MEYTPIIRELNHRLIEISHNGKYALIDIDRIEAIQMEPQHEIQHVVEICLSDTYCRFPFAERENAINFYNDIAGRLVLYTNTDEENQQAVREYNQLKNE